MLILLDYEVKLERVFMQSRNFLFRCIKVNVQMLSMEIGLIHTIWEYYQLGMIDHTIPS